MTDGLTSDGNIRDVRLKAHTVCTGRSTVNRGTAVYLLRQRLRMASNAPCIDSLTGAPVPSTTLPFRIKMSTCGQFRRRCR